VLRNQDKKRKKISNEISAIGVRSYIERQHEKGEYQKLSRHGKYSRRCQRNWNEHIRRMTYEC
jgi:hypothetical protein